MIAYYWKIMTFRILLMRRMVYIKAPFHEYYDWWQLGIGKSSLVCEGMHDLHSGKKYVSVTSEWAADSGKNFDFVV